MASSALPGPFVSVALQNFEDCAERNRAWVRDFAVLTFNQIEDRESRARFHAMPTTFRLQADQVDALIAQSRALLERSPEFNAFLRRVGQPESDR